jgi:hypothetical protein
MRELILRPVLSDEQLAALDNQFLTSEHVCEEISTTTIGRTADGRIRLVFVRNVIDLPQQELAMSTIARIGNSAAQSNRAAVRGQSGKEAVWGFMEAGTFRPDSSMTALTFQHLEKFIKTLPFFQAVNAGFSKYWPEAYSRQLLAAQQIPEYIIPGTVFSTGTINGNVITRAHTDDGNAEGTISCLTQFGNFKGGHVCVARFGVLIKSFPGALLLADIRDELHGNMEPAEGDDRVACVTYLRGGLLPGAGSR